MAGEVHLTDDEIRRVCDALDTQCEVAAEDDDPDEVARLVSLKNKIREATTGGST